MPPLCSEKRCPRSIGRHSSVSSKVTRPTLLIRNVEDDSDDADESDENISPDADKSEIRFTLERKRDKDGRDDNNNDNNNKNNDNGNRRGRNRSKGDRNQDRRNGRGGDSNDTSRSRDGGDGDRGSRFGEKGDKEDDDDDKGKPNNNGEGNRRKGGDGNGDNDDEGNGQDENKNGDGEEGNGKGGPGKDGGSNSDSNDNSSTSLSPPPPPPAATSTTSVAEASITTSVVSTSIPASETTISSTLQDSITSVVTALPAVTNPPLTMTTSVVSDSDSILDNSQTSITFPATGLADSSSAPAPAQTKPANGHGKENGHHGWGNNNNNNNNGNNRGDRGGLSRTSERILVAAGSIGAFIVLCFIVWIICRTLKKSKQSSSKDNSNSWLSRLIPWRRKPETNNVQALRGTYEPQESLPAYDAGSNNMEAFGYYDRRKLYPLESENTAYLSAVTPGDGRAVWQAPEEGQIPPPANSLGQYPQPNNQITDSSDADATLRSRMPDLYYNQSEFARQPSDAYNPAQRQVYRASEISSLSSGFGDGDIIMPPPNVMIPKTPIAATNADTSNRPFSWMTRTGAEQRRDTVYTTTSERRFRSVSSWVDQQKKRMKRAG